MNSASLTDTTNIRRSGHGHGSLLSPSATAVTNCILPAPLPELFHNTLNSWIPKPSHKQPRTNMSRVHSPSFKTAPAHDLPTETLIHIFRLVLQSPCRDSATRVKVSRRHVWHPNCLVHVCSRWREIGLTLPSLWTHIDLTPEISIGGALMNSARVYARRTGKLPVKVHLDDQGCVGEDDYFTLESTLQFLAPRMKALDFVITAPRLLDFHRSTFNYLIPLLLPESFKSLRMSAESPLPDPFFVGQSIGSSPHYLDDADSDEGPPILECEDTVIDRHFAGVTSVHLHGVFFDWSSKLYHSLVDLRLTCPPTGSIPTIHEHKLTSILSDSPKLRILHFSLRLISERHRDIEPVALRNLEVVQVSTIGAYSRRNTTPFHAVSLLRLLAPGSKPLRLRLEVSPDEPLFDSDHMKEFLGRCRVERLCLRGGQFSMNESGPGYLSGLKVLVLDSCYRISVCADLDSPLRLHSCFIRGAKLNLDDLRSMVGLCPDLLVLYMCKVYLEDQGREMTAGELRVAFPGVQFPISWANPTADWDVVH